MIDYKKLLLPEWGQTEPYFEFTDKQRRHYVPARLDPWRVANDDKGIPVHECPGADEMVLEVYPQAIVVGAPFGAVGKNFWGVFAFLMLMPMSLMALWITFDGFMQSPILNTILAPFGVLFFLVSISFLRLATSTPPDWPIMFNKATRSVTFFPPAFPDIIFFWKPVASKCVTRSWDAVRVRDYKYTTTMAARTFRDSYSLCLLWGEEDNPKQLKDHVAIGEESSWQDDSLFRLWEHIRRYMEEGGPPILPGEHLRDLDRTKLPQFPPEIIAAAGGPALGAEDLAKLATTGQA